MSSPFSNRLCRPSRTVSLSSHPKATAPKTTSSPPKTSPSAPSLISSSPSSSTTSPKLLSVSPLHPSTLVTLHLSQLMITRPTLSGTYLPRPRVRTPSMKMKSFNPHLGGSPLPLLTLNSFPLTSPIQSKSKGIKSHKNGSLSPVSSFSTSLKKYTSSPKYSPFKLPLNVSLTNVTGGSSLNALSKSFTVENLQFW